MKAAARVCRYCGYRFGEAVNRQEAESASTRQKGSAGQPTTPDENRPAVLPTARAVPGRSRGIRWYSWLGLAAYLVIGPPLVSANDDWSVPGDVIAAVAVAVFILLVVGAVRFAVERFRKHRIGVLTSVVSLWATGLAYAVITLNFIGQTS